MGGNTNSSTLPVSSTKNQIFQNDEKKMEVKFALKQENRLEVLKKLANKAPRLELKVEKTAII
jgi:hypothetical protein